MRCQIEILSDLHDVTCRLGLTDHQKTVNLTSMNNNISPVISGPKSWPAINYKLSEMTKKSKKEQKKEADFGGVGNLGNH